MDRLSKEQRSTLMSRIGSRNTGPEMRVRSLLHRLGYRFRLHRSDLPGTPDIVFPGRRKAIFVHGCFWHGHACKVGKMPKSNKAYWDAKIAGNRAHDDLVRRRMAASGWRSLVVWECEIKDEPALARKVKRFLG